jgi:hypothetical protein
MARHIKDINSGLDYNKQPLPLFGVWDCYSSTTYAFNVYDSDFQPVSRTSNQNFNGINSEFASSNTFDTTTGITSNAGAYIKSTNQISADGHPGFSGNADGSYSWKLYSSVSNTFSYFGVVVGPEGYRQNFSLSSGGRTLTLYNRGTQSYIDSQALNAAHATFSSAGITTGRGLAGYNRNTGTLVWMEPNDGNGGNYRVHRWINPNRKLTGKAGDLTQFITEAKAGTNGSYYSYFDFTWNPNNGSTELETLNKARMFPCNNGKITITRMIPSNRIEVGILTPATTTPAADGLISATFVYRGFVALTTSYGLAQGAAYGIKYNISWDNKWVMVYCPYYYYHCGFAGFLINVDDPTISYSLSVASSADGIQCVPLGRSGFLLGLSYVNADSGAGMYTGVVDASQGRQPDGTVLTPGGSISYTPGLGFLDTAYTTTNYPCILPVERWFVQGAGQNG